MISRERLVATDVFRHFGWDVEASRLQVLDGFVMSTFRNLLFQRVIPNLNRIGLLTDKIRPKFEELGILDYENLATDGDIDWSALERPLDTQEAQSHEQSMLAAFSLSVAVLLVFHLMRGSLPRGSAAALAFSLIMGSSFMMTSHVVIMADSEQPIP